MAVLRKLQMITGSFESKVKVQRTSSAARAWFKPKWVNVQKMTTGCFKQK